MKPFPPSVTAGIFAALLLPFGLSFLSPQLEPYPALIMPSGAGLLRPATKQIQFRHITLWGRRGSGEWFQLDSRALVDPIPIWYLDGIVQNEFGLRTPREEPVALRRITTIHVPKRQPSHEAVLQTEAWLRARLQAAGARPSVLRVTQEQMTVSIPEGRVMNTVVISERVYQVDHSG